MKRSDVVRRGLFLAVVAGLSAGCPGGDPKPTDETIPVGALLSTTGDLAGIGDAQLTMVGVDRTKKDAEGLTVKHDILRVPTFVFFRGEKEIGRVVERATTTLEADIAAILAK